MHGDYIGFRDARQGQAAALAAATVTIGEQVRRQAAEGSLCGPGPIFAAIGASLAAASAPVWSLRSRGIHAWRLQAGDHPLPFPVTDHPVIGVSQSGRTAETLAVLESIGRPRRYAVTNHRPSPIDAAADDGLWLGDLPDSFASTVGYTATVMGLGMIAEAWDGGTIDPAWGALPDAVRVLEPELERRVAALTDPLDGALMVDFVGGGAAVGSAEVGALLFREVARMPTAAMSTRQYLHGPMESAGRSAHVLIGDTRELNLAAMLVDAGHPVILVTAAAIAERPGLQVVRLPAIAPCQRAVLEAVVMQALAVALADRRGVDVEAFVFHNPDTKVDPEPAEVEVA